MPKTVSILPRERFATAKVDLLAGWDFVFIAGCDEDEIIAACRVPEARRVR